MSYYGSQAKFFHGGRCWMSDTNHPNYEAGRKATKYVYGVEPDLTREGGSIPVTLVLQVKDSFVCVVFLVII